jgi:hypothetical protein
MITSDNTILNLDNLALMLMETAIRNCSEEGVDISSGKGKDYVLAVKSIALKIKANQALAPTIQERVLDIIYRYRPHKATMGSMRKILSEIGSELEYVQHKVLKNEKL